MTRIPTPVAAGPLRLRLRPVLDMTDDDFFAFCQINRDLRMERTKEGDLLIMTPVGGETGDRNAELTMQLRVWAKRDGMGVAFDSSTGFILPDGATRSPDASWVRRSRLATLSPEQKRRFVPLCPDFVVEIRSPLDDLDDLLHKMQEWIDNGARLGWLIDPDPRRVHVYRPGAPVERLDGATSLGAEPVLPGFRLDLQGLWKPDLGSE